MEFIGVATAGLKVVGSAISFLDGKQRSAPDFESKSPPDLDKIVGRVACQEGKKKVGTDIEILNYVFHWAPIDLRHYFLAFEGELRPNDMLVRSCRIKERLGTLVSKKRFKYVGTTPITGFIIYSRTFVPNPIVRYIGGKDSYGVKISIDVGGILSSFYDIDVLIFAKRRSSANLSSITPGARELNSNVYGVKTSKAKKQSTTKASQQSTTAPQTVLKYEGKHEKSSDLSAYKSSSKRKEVTSVKVKKNSNSIAKDVKDRKKCKKAENTVEECDYDETIKSDERKSRRKVDQHKRSNNKKDRTNKRTETKKTEGESECIDQKHSKADSSCSSDNDATLMKTKRKQKRKQKESTESSSSDIKDSDGPAAGTTPPPERRRRPGVVTVPQQMLQ